MRDKLESLIDTFFASVDIDKFYSQNQKEKLVKWLRENGVFVPYCKVGDVVYRVSRYWNSYKLKWEFEISDEGVAFAEPNLVFTSSKGNVFFERDIGKTVFLTREEAEQALKGGEQG